MITLYGSDYSVYLRSARLALEEKGAAYELVPVDVFAPDGPPESFLKLNPFGKVPVFSHADLTLYETSAILRYVDEALDGPPLQPEEPRQRARMNQILSLLDSEAYPILVWEIYVERMVKTRGGHAADEVRISSAIGRARVIVSALESLCSQGPFLLGSHLTLADCHAAPMLHLFDQAEEGQVLLKSAPKLSGWLDRIRQQKSFEVTTPGSD